MLREAWGAVRAGRHRVAAGVALLFLAASGVVSCSQDPAPTIVLITVDTLRADAVAFAGGERRTTPFLDELAEKGLVFRRAYAPSSWTAPSMASLFTGLSPLSHGVQSGSIGRTRGESRDTRVVAQPQLAVSFDTLAERLAAAGYTTIGVPSNLHLASALGFGQGFDHYAEARFISAPEVNAEVERQLQRAFGKRWRSAWKEGPTFLWVHYFDPHIPYRARAPWVQQYAPDFADDPAAYPAGLDFPSLLRRYPRPDRESANSLWPLYESEVSYVDQHIRLLDELLGFTDERVLLIVTSDHGEQLGEHGGLGHGEQLYEETTRVPLLLHWPSGLGEARDFSRLVSLEDLLPTLCELLGLPVGEGVTGRNVFEPRGKKGRALLLQTGRRASQTALRTQHWKLIRIGADERELFHLPTDPHERRNLAARRPRRMRRMDRRLERRLEQLPKPPEGRAVPVEDRELREQLRALGYGD